jgi:serine phosphatase RsbU (regulator of sigma subunit)/pSer/pThr/pTyr-binding forkhead associated (FHA) protein
VAFLELTSGPRAGERVRLAKERTVIGRHPACDFVIDVSAVSRQHAVITIADGRFLVEDLRSRNGTSLNGRPLTERRPLEDGDELLICDQRLVFTTTGTAPSARAAVTSSTGLVDEELLGPEPEADHSMIVSQVEVSRPSGDEGLGVHAEAKLRAVIGLNRAIGASLSLDEVLPRLLDGLFQIFPQAERGFVLLAEPTSRRLVLRARKTTGDDESGPLRLSRSLIDRVVHSHRAVLSADAVADSRFKSSDSIADSRIRSVMCVPFLEPDGSVLGVVHVDSRNLRAGFTEADLDVLAGIADDAGQAIRQALAHDERVGQEQLKRDLELAQRVQQGLLPSRPPDIEGYQLFDFYEPAHQIGGDFFGYIPLPDGRMAIVLADVSGKGVSAALVMAALSADVRYCLASDRDIAAAVSRINESFVRSGWDDRFATLIVAALDPRDHSVTMVCAGHLPAFLRDAAGNVRMVGTEESGLPLGLDVDRGYNACRFEMAPGSMLVLYTDGISEAMDHEDRLYGFEQLEAMIAGPASTAEEMGRRILADVERHATGQIRSDDMCLVCLARPA